MAGRAVQRRAPTPILALDSVPDSATQRAFDATQDAVQTAQTDIRKLRETVTGLGDVIGGFASPVRTDVEIAAGVTPVDFRYPVGCVDRYGVNTTPGATDMTDAARSAISVVIRAGGGVVLWLGAKYLVGSTGTFIAYTASSVLHVGASRESTQVINGAAANPAIQCGDGITAVYGGGIVSMSFSQQSGVTALNGNCAFLFTGLGQFAIRDVFVSNNTSSPYRGVVFTAGSIGCSQFVVNNLQVQGCLNDGISLINTTDAYITDCRSDANAGAGWLLNGAQGTFAKSCTTFDNDGVAWGLQSSNPGVLPNKNNFFWGCIGDTSGSYNWQINDSQDSRWVGCWGGTQQSTAVNTFACGFLIVTSASTRLVFDSCIAVNNNAQGFNVFDDGTAPTYIVLSSCQYTFNGRSGTGYGLALNGAVDHVRVAGGTFQSNPTGQVLNTSGSSDILFTGNPVGYVTVNQGTGTIAIGASSVAVTHGLGLTPALSNISVTDTSSRAASSINSVWTSAPTGTQFTVNSNANVAGANFTFVWRAAANGS